MKIRNKKIEKKDKILMILAVVILVSLLIVLPVIFKVSADVHAKTEVKIEDAGMEQVMNKLYAVTNDETGETKPLTYNELDSVEIFHTGSWNYYESIEDLTKCENLTQLHINSEPDDIEQLNSYNTETVISQDKVNRFCNDLKEILKKDKQLSQLYIHGNGEKIEDFSFLESENNLKYLGLYNISMDDFSKICECKHLQYVYIESDSLKTASQLECLTKLKGLSEISVSNTPLAKDENELKKLKEMFPVGVLIYHDYEVNVKDPGMKQVMTDLYAGTSSDTKEKSSLRNRNLDDVISFSSGSWAYYDTIADIAELKNLKSLYLNSEPDDKKQLNACNTETVISEDKLKVFCDDLQLILKEDKYISSLGIYGNAETMDNLNFLTYGSYLGRIELYNLSINDFSGLGKCKSLQDIYIKSDSLKSASQLECLKDLPNLRNLAVSNTPLAKDENELNKLQEMLPNVCLRTDNKVTIEDSGMEQVMSELYADMYYNTGERWPLTNIELDEVKSFYSGSWNYYESIADIAKLKNLETLYLNKEPNNKKHPNSYSTGTVISEDKMKVFCNDLNVILKDTHLKYLEIYGNGEKMENVSFLEYGNDLKYLRLSNLSIDDYSGIGGCKNLKEVYIKSDSIKTADQLECLKKLDNLQTVKLVNAPIVNDTNEFNKLREMLPNVQVQNSYY